MWNWADNYTVWELINEIVRPLATPRLKKQTQNNSLPELFKNFVKIVHFSVILNTALSAMVVKSIDVVLKKAITFNLGARAL